MDLMGPLVRRGRLESTPTSQDVFESADRAWQALADDRERRRRNRDYLFGRQWREEVETPDGHVLTEREAIEAQGREPWQANRLRPIIRNLKGQLRKNQSDRQVFAVNDSADDAGEMLTKALRAIRRINKMESQEADELVEHLLAGKAAFRVGYKYRHKFDRPEVTITPVNTLRLFYNPDVSDRQLQDLRLIGQIHDMELADVLNAFAPRDREAEQAIREYYGERDHSRYESFGLSDFGRADSLSFRTPEDPDLTRVIEVWRKESHRIDLIHDHETGRLHRASLPDAQVEQENQARRQRGMAPIEARSRREAVWVGYFLTPTGEVLWSGRTPYRHQSHPYALGFAEMMDGEVRGLMDDLVDQQRLYNRMLQIMDMGLATAARGVLMIPEESIPDSLSIEEFAEEYQKVNGVVVYSATGDEGQQLPSQHAPQQVFSNSIPAGAFEWLSQMRNDMREVSGVTGPAMGETPKSGTPAALYNQQILRSQTTTRDLFETYFEVLHETDRKAVQLAAQYYDDGRRVVAPDGEQAVIDREKIKGLQLDVALAQVADTATYRQLFEQDLQQMRSSAEITFRQYLKMSSHPKADELLKLIERTNPLVEQGQSPADQAPDASPKMRRALQAMGEGTQAATRPASTEGAMNNRRLRARLLEMAEDGDRDAQALLKQAA
jgi:hypothetical protein